MSAGSTIGFKLDNTLYHSGPAAMYLGKAPGRAADWDGSGANWFKVTHSHPTTTSIIRITACLTDC